MKKIIIMGIIMVCIFLVASSSANHSHESGQEDMSLQGSESAFNTNYNELSEQFHDNMDNEGEKPLTSNVKDISNISDVYMVYDDNEGKKPLSSNVKDTSSENIKEIPREYVNTTNYGKYESNDNSYSNEDLYSNSIDMESTGNPMYLLLSFLSIMFFVFSKKFKF